MDWQYRDRSPFEWLQSLSDVKVYDLLGRPFTSEGAESEVITILGLHRLLAGQPLGFYFISGKREDGTAVSQPYFYSGE